MMKSFLKVQVILLSTLFSTTHVFAAGTVVESVSAIVNGGIITKTDTERYRVQLKKGALADDLLGDSPDKLLKDQKALLNHMINERIIDDEVKKQNLNVTIERVEQEINSIQKRNNGLSREQLKEALKQQGTSFADYQEFIKKRLERQGLIEKAVTSKVKVSDDDVIDAYEAKFKSQTATSAEFKIAHILLREGKRPDSVQKERAEEVYKKLKGGANFETLASQYSEDPNFNEGGLLGGNTYFQASDLLKELGATVRTMAPGEFSKPIKTKLGYQIIKLVDHRIIPDPDFEKKKETIRQELYQKAFVKQFQFWLEQQRQEAYIRIN